MSSAHLLSSSVWSFGLVEESTYMGLALDNNIIALTSLFLFYYTLNTTLFTVVLYFLLLVLVVLNVAPIRTPKLTGRWYSALTVYTLVMTAVYGWQLLYLQEG